MSRRRIKNQQSQKKNRGPTSRGLKLITMKAGPGDDCDCPICQMYGIDMENMAVGETSIIEVPDDYEADLFTMRSMMN